MKTQNRNYSFFLYSAKFHFFAFHNSSLFVITYDAKRFAQRSSYLYKKNIFVIFDSSSATQIDRLLLSLECAICVSTNISSSFLTQHQQQHAHCSVYFFNKMFPILFLLPVTTYSLFFDAWHLINNIHWGKFLSFGFYRSKQGTWRNISNSSHWSH